MLRLSDYLKIRFPNQKFALLADNCPSHEVSTTIKNLEIIMLPPKTTGYLQPLDVSTFGHVKRKYRQWLSDEKVLQTENSPKLTEETAVKNGRDIQEFEQKANKPWIP